MGSIIGVDDFRISRRDTHLLKTAANVDKNIACKSTYREHVRFDENRRAQGMLRPTRDKIERQEPGWVGEGGVLTLGRRVVVLTYKSGHQYVFKGTIHIYMENRWSTGLQ